MNWWIKKKTVDSRYVYRNTLGKACFLVCLAYGIRKDLQNRTYSDKFLKNKAFSSTNGQWTVIKSD